VFPFFWPLVSPDTPAFPGLRLQSVYNPGST
jgi:hypothetical protein